MKKNAVSTGFVLFAMATLMLSVSATAQDSGVVAHDAWMRMPAPSKMDAALYFVLENHSATAKTVVSASSDGAAKLEMHEMKTVNKDDSMSKSGSDSGSMSMSTDKPASQPMMTMSPVSKVEIPANGKVTFAPNGLHIMVFGLKSRPAMGDKINVTLKLKDGSTVPVVATVK